MIEKFWQTLKVADGAQYITLIASGKIAGEFY